MQCNPRSPAPNPATSHSSLQSTRMCDCQLKILPHQVQCVWLHFEDGDPRQDAQEGARSQRYQEWNQDQRDPRSKWRTGGTTCIKKWIRLMDTKERQENSKWLRQCLKQAWLFNLFFLSPLPPPPPALVKSLHFNSRRPLILPENIFTWSIFCFTWHTALAQPFPLSIHLGSIFLLYNVSLAQVKSPAYASGWSWEDGDSLTEPHPSHRYPHLYQPFLSSLLKQNKSLGPWPQDPNTKW